MNNPSLSTKEFIDDYLLVRGKKIPVKRGMVNQSQLSFYPENPRIYSLVAQDRDNPTQSQILSELEKMDHVKQLVKSIRLNGGLIEPIIVRDGDGCVLEGNSRLAAYRILSRPAALEWELIDCKILPADISDSAIFSLLGEFHIVGKKDWAPFEQAGYLYRRHTRHGIKATALADEVGISVREIGHLISVYQYMVDVHEADINKWSYYDAFLRSRKLKAATERYSGLEAKIVRMIKQDQFPRAADMRDKLPVIVEAGSKTVQKLIKNELTFEEALERAQQKTDKAGTVRNLRKFREWVCDAEIAEAISSLPEEAKSDCKYELNRIHRRLNALITVLGKS